MITAEVLVKTNISDLLVPVAVTKYARPGWVWVRTLDGSEPFGRFSTMSGAYGVDSIMLPVPKLQNITWKESTEMDARKRYLNALNMKDQAFADLKAVEGQMPTSGINGNQVYSTCYYAVKSLYEQAVTEYEDARAEWLDEQAEDEAIPVALSVNVKETALQ